jgi:hypothetical protein
VSDFIIKGLFAPAARDPRLIPGVHRYCDEWCARCPVRDRCLVSRALDIYRKARNRSSSEQTFADDAEALEFRREIAAAEGVPAAAHDARASGERSMRQTLRDEPLAEVAWDYAVGVSVWLVFTPAEIQRLAQSVTAPPEEVVLWHHLRIYVRIVRALSAQQRRPGVSIGDEEYANGCAKAALVAAQRSRQALLQIKRRGASQAGSLIALLERIERGIDEQFPQARAFIRVGLDVPAA